VGLTKYRAGLYPLEPFEKEDARAVIEIIEKWQKKSFEIYGDHFVQASDEWYLIAELPLPEAERYDGYIQLENGVGMLRLLHDEFYEALAHAHKFLWKKREVSMASGKLAAPFIEQMSRDFEKKFPKIKIHNYTIINHFFGERITVSGLITGQDLMEQLKDKELGSMLYLPSNMLRMGENVFLDDVTVEQVEDSLQVPIDIVKSSGGDFVEALLRPHHDTTRNNIIDKK
jgi:NifB/MoaA-like Fe-S oxidoreductase